MHSSNAHRTLFALIVIAAALTKVAVPMSSHVLRVRVLYKRILRVHRALPPEMRALGDSYVKEEFKKHKGANAVQAEIFMRNWTEYCVTLAKQVQKPSFQPNIGKQLDPSHVDSFTDEQLLQLYELQQEVVKAPAGGADKGSS